MQSGYFADEVINVDEVIETANHFRCIDLIIESAKAALTEKFIKELHLILKSGTSDSRKEWFAVGNYKKLLNEVGGMETTLPEEVAGKMKALLSEYNAKEDKTLNDILEFHVRFEKMHPFQEGNGRVGRLIMFKECLKYNIVPFIIEDNWKLYYYRGLKEWMSFGRGQKGVAVAMPCNISAIYPVFYDGIEGKKMVY